MLNCNRYDLGGDQAIDGQERGEAFIGNRGRQGTCLPPRLLVKRVLKMCKKINIYEVLVIV
jgi:hypothetical protein